MEQTIKLPRMDDPGGSFDIGSHAFDARPNTRAEIFTKSKWRFFHSWAEFEMSENSCALQRLTFEELSVEKRILNAFSMYINHSF